jgi:hypothetical protein
LPQYWDDSIIKQRHAQDICKSINLHKSWLIGNRWIYPTDISSFKIGRGQDSSVNTTTGLLAAPTNLSDSHQRQRMFYSQICTDWLWGLSSSLLNAYWTFYLRVSGQSMKQIILLCVAQKLQTHKARLPILCGLLPQGGFTSSNQAVYGSF